MTADLPWPADPSSAPAALPLQGVEAGFAKAGPENDRTERAGLWV